MRIMDVHSISTLELSNYLNVIRGFLLKKKFFEHHLYSTTDYKIENTKSFGLGNGLFLRYNPEPDIWTAGSEHDSFFWIGSMFRDDDRSSLHKKEFTVVDIYLKNKAMRDVVDFFLAILKNMESSLKLKSLSKLPTRYISHAEFNQMPATDERFWAIVTNYPVDESFYDEREGTATKKFEIFFVDGEEKVEIAACGVLGDNLNKSMFVKEKSRIVDKKIAEKKFIGFGFGIERLIYLYRR